MAGLNLSINKILESQKKGQTGGNRQSQDGKAREWSGITCFRWHNKIQFQDNFPLEKNSGESSWNKETPETGSETSTSWRYKRTENWEPNTKVLNDSTYNFYKKCGRWNSGGRRNSSDDHKTKEDIIKLKYSSRNIEANHDKNPPGGRILHMMGSLFLV